MYYANQKAAVYLHYKNNNMEQEKKKGPRGGPRAGSGRPKLIDAKRRILTTVRLRADHHEAIKGRQTAIIEAALDQFLHTGDAESPKKSKRKKS